ncbi:hypothetical protein A167_03053 [Alcanivorax sp. S71-1-4]|uniref:choice-of-anchor I family protein n=1 Tax=Alcanivorax sp. S71-1-4 TaxID=1177159 RepID=UPI00135A6510|nr:choice-of-anchor I family protein [Alcanivorax sp. S71-1-4]KAF0807006.1 hypothetical protein A167_03053 [Alcanivorax sp. S71-1-4]
MKHWLALSFSAVLVTTLAGCGGSSSDRNPPPEEQTPASLSLSLLGRYSTNQFDESAAEITAYDAAGQRVFVVNAQKGAVDVLDVSQPGEPVFLEELSVTDLVPGATVNSVALRGNLMALAVQAAVKTDNGYVALYSLDDLTRISHVGVGALPDMLTFTPDGQHVLVANEGEPSDDYQTDPEGSISIINVTDPANLTVETADFTAFNGQEAALRASGVRIYGPNASAAQDFEPEYIAVSADSSTAWAILQENNAFARIDIASATVTDILPLGYKDIGVEGNGIDASDEDDIINIRTFAGVRGMYLPDAIAAYEMDGATYIVSANEGDARAWGEDNDAYWGSTDDCSDADPSQGFVEELRVKHLVHSNGFARRCGDDMPPQLFSLAAGGLLNPDVFGYCGATAGDAGDCREDDVLGRLNISWVMGYRQHADGTPVMFNAAGEEDVAGDRIMYDELYAYGGRSFAIWDADGQLVWDSGDAFEQYLASDECMVGPQRSIPCKDYFNSGHDEGDAFDSRSDAKGPEPEGVALGAIGEKTFAFVGLERMGGVFVYDITDPQAPAFVDYFNSRENWTADPETSLSIMGDLGPEGLTFVPASQSPNGEALLIIGNEVSGSTSVFQVNRIFD